MNDLTIDNMTGEQLQALQEQILIKRMADIGNRLEHMNSEIGKQSEHISRIGSDLKNFENSMPLFGVECDRITTIAKQKGVECLGGKKSSAYKDICIRGKVYSDIYKQLKREFGVTSYKAIKRNQVEMAAKILEGYAPPMAIRELIDDCNSN